MVANEIKKTEEIVDGNTAAAEGSYIFSEVAAIYNTLISDGGECG